MPYHLIDSRENGYRIYESDAYVDYDPYMVLLQYFKKIFSDDIIIKIISQRVGSKNRRERLIKIIFNESPISKAIYIYCFQTESGGRWRLIRNGKNEARVQWRSCDQWQPNLNTLTVAKNFTDSILKKESLINKRCFILSVYKRNLLDDDIIISGIYPTQAQNVEIKSKTNKSIQFNFKDIQEAFIKGVSVTTKTNDHLVIHFRPEFLAWYLLNSDKIHSHNKYDFEEIYKPTIKSLNDYSKEDYKEEFNNQILDCKDIDINYHINYSDKYHFLLSNEHICNLLLSGEMLKALELIIKETITLGYKIDILEAKRIVQSLFKKLNNQYR